MRTHTRGVGSELGSDLVEYALIAAIFALLSLAALQGLRVTVGNAYANWNNNFRNLAAPAAPGA